MANRWVCPRSLTQAHTHAQLISLDILLLLLSRCRCISFAPAGNSTGTHTNCCQPTHSNRTTIRMHRHSKNMNFTYRSKTGFYFRYQKSTRKKKTSLEILRLNNLLCDSGEYCPKLISTAESTRKCRILEKRMISKLINFAPLHGNCVRSCVRVREWVPWHTLLTCQKFPHFSLAKKGIATKIPQKVAKKYVTKFPLFICVLSPVMN